MKYSNANDAKIAVAQAIADGKEMLGSSITLAATIDGNGDRIAPSYVGVTCGAGVEDRDIISLKDPEKPRTFSIWESTVLDSTTGEKVKVTASPLDFDVLYTNDTAITFDVVVSKSGERTYKNARLVSANVGDVAVNTAKAIEKVK